MKGHVAFNYACPTQYSKCPRLPRRCDRYHHIVAGWRIRGDSANENEAHYENELTLPSKPLLQYSEGKQLGEMNDQPFTPLCTLCFNRSLLLP